MALSRVRRHPLSPDLLLLFFIVLVCASLVGLHVRQAWREHDERLAMARTQTSNLARSIAQHVQDTFDAVAGFLLAVAERVASDGTAPAALGRLEGVMRSRMASLPQLRAMSVADEHGRVIATSLSQPGGAATLADRAFFQYHRDHFDTKTFVGMPIRTKRDGAWVVTASRRLNHADGSFAGVVCATLTIMSFQNFFASFDIGAEGAISLIRGDATMLARSLAGDEQIGRNISQSQIFRDVPRDAIARDVEAISVIDGTARLASVRRIPWYDLAVIVSRTRREILAPWWRSTQIQSAWLALVLLTLVVLGHRIAVHIRRRLTAERRYRLLADNSSDAILCTGLDGRLHYISPSFWKMTGWTPRTVPGHEWVHIVPFEDHPIVERLVIDLLSGAEEVSGRYRYLRPDSTALWVEVRARVACDARGAPTEFVSNIRDVTSQKDAEDRLADVNAELAALTLTDPLTGLANRRHFDQSLRDEWNRAMRDARPLTLLMIDADSFKSYNDTYGHPSGDECLRSIARVLARVGRRPGDVVARFGGEEFVVLLTGVRAEQAAELAERLRDEIEALAIPHRGNGPGVVTISIGAAAVTPRRGLASHTLVHAADEALYAAKRDGRNRVALAADQAALLAEPQL